jgi:glycosyltransferase involved in cell wall biosynthesis
LAVEGFLKYRQRNPSRKAHLVMTGDFQGTPMGRRTVDAVRKAGVENAITLTGLIDRESLRALYQSAIGMLMLTRLETFGHPFVEAMAAGAPVVRLRSEFGDELCGSASLVCAEPDAAHVCAAMERLDSDPEFRERLIQAGRKRAEDFSWNREGLETLSLLRKGHRISRADR